MKELFSRQVQLGTMTKICRSSYLTSCFQAVIYGVFLMILLEAWQSGAAFFLLNSFTEKIKHFVRGWATLGYVLFIVRFFVQMEQIPQYLDILQSDDPRYDLKKHIDCIRWIAVVCGYSLGFIIAFWATNETTTLDDRVLYSGMFLLVVLMIAIGRDLWRMTGLSPSTEGKITSLTDQYRVARELCRNTLKHRPFVDVDFDLIYRELHRQALM